MPAQGLGCDEAPAGRSHEGALVIELDVERILALLGIEQEVSGPEEVLAEIDRLEAAISALDPANGKLSRINARLRALTSRVSGLKGPAEGPARKFSTESSSDDEIFSFIDDQLT